MWFTKDIGMSMGQASLVHDFDNKSGGGVFALSLIAVVLVTAFLGVWTGYLLAHGHVLSRFTNVHPSSQQNSMSGTTYTKGQIIGSSDTTTFTDTAEGTLESGGINNEGQYHLVRSGGESQNVYLTS